jgi:hypothetical protein
MAAYLRTKGVIALAMVGRIAMVAAALALACVTLPDLDAALAQSADAAQSNTPTSGHRSHRGARAAPTPAPGIVIQGGDTISLIATLPWWRIDESRTSDDESGQLESPILTACDVWLGFPFATTDAKSLTVRLAQGQHASEIDQVANHVTVADAGEVNELDLAAPEEQHDTGSPWLRTLLALLGLAAAGFSAARYFWPEGPNAPRLWLKTAAATLGNQLDGFGRRV